MRNEDPSPTICQNGFTLVEVLVSSAILLALVALLLGMSHSASQFWSDSEGKREALRELQSSLQIMTEDLHSAVITPEEESFEIQNPTKDAQSLFFLVSHPSDHRHAETKGDLCAVGYFLAPDPEQKGLTNLYRFHMAGESVCKAVESNSLHSLYSQASPGNISTTEMLARNIISLRIIQLPAETESPGLLEVTLSSINTKTARLLASDPQATQRNARLLNQREQKVTALVQLPASRERSSMP